MKAIEVIARALRLLKVIAADEAPSAEDSRDALEVMNGLFAEWRGSDIFIPDAIVEDVTDDLTIDRADREAVAYQVALRLSPEYGETVSTEFRVAMEEAFSRLRLRYFQPGTADLSELPHAAGDYRGYNIDLC